MKDTIKLIYLYGKKFSLCRMQPQANERNYCWSELYLWKLLLAILQQFLNILYNHFLVWGNLYLSFLINIFRCRIVFRRWKPGKRLFKTKTFQLLSLQLIIYFLLRCKKLLVHWFAHYLWFVASKYTKNFKHNLEISQI